MNKKEAVDRLSAIEKETSELRKIIEMSDAPPKPTAKEWLLNFLSEPFEVRLTKECITYYRDGQWIFQQDLKNKYLWCYYYKVWKVFEIDFILNYNQIQSLIKDVVGKALNCEQFEPYTLFRPNGEGVGKALNCERLSMRVTG